MLLFVSLIILLTDLVVTLAVKYYLNGLTLADVDLLQPGNLIHLILVLVLGMLYTFVTFRKKRKPDNGLTKFPVFILLGIALTVIGYFVIVSENTALMAIVYWDYKLFYILAGILFAAHYLVILGFISHFWLQLSKAQNLLIIRTGVNAAIFSILLFFVSFFYCVSADNNLNSKGNFLTGFILGSAVTKENTPGNSLKRRLDTGISLYTSGVIKIFFLTGGNSPGRLSEAEAGQAYLIRNEVPKDKIEFENKTTSTLEQLRFIKNHYKTKSEIQNLLVISDSFHLPRIKQMAGFFNINPALKGVESNHSFTQQFYTTSRESVALIIFWLFAI